MPFSQRDVSETAGSFVVSSNRSLGRKGTAWVFCGICIAALFIAVRFWLLGAWMVLPIFVLELLLLGTAFLVVERKTRFSETIELTEESVSVVQKDWRSQREWCYPKYWVQVVFRQDPAGWYPSHLYLRSHGDTLEIGTCLNDSERKQLSGHLRRMINRSGLGEGQGG